MNRQKIRDFNKSLIDSNNKMLFEEYCNHIDEIIELDISQEEKDNIHELIQNGNNDQLTNKQCRYLLSNEIKIKYYNDYVCALV